MRQLLDRYLPLRLGSWAAVSLNMVWMLWLFTLCELAGWHVDILSYILGMVVSLLAFLNHEFWRDRT